MAVSETAVSALDRKWDPGDCLLEHPSLTPVNHFEPRPQGDSVDCYSLRGESHVTDGDSFL